MLSAEDVLNSLDENDPALYAVTTSDTNQHIVIGEDRFITVPPELKKIAVQHDHNMKTVTFDCPRYQNGEDMSGMQIFISYRRSDGKKGSYIADNVSVDQSDSSIIHFDWTITKYASYANGPLIFLVCVKKSDDEGNELNHWNSELNKDMHVSEGMEVDVLTEEPYPDLITQMLTRLDDVEDSTAISVKRMETIIQDANDHTTTGYAKTCKDLTQNLPEQVYGTKSERGVLFFIAENVEQRTGTQFFYPIDGPYKGRIFVRSLTLMCCVQPEIGAWSLLTTEADVETNYQKKPKATTIDIPISGWTGSGLLYSQTVSVPIVIGNSQVDLRPSPDQLQELLTSEISLTAANESGSVTVFAIGGKPTSDYTMQIIVSEVEMV